ncbi:MAG TPA: polysaccharide biosynthesis tyrosine autokinase [Polyangiaceae bacterium]|jgi:capsular exopolysaccharide synthesis family protein|nr:polysaccharide biosynthesis tyrosine autokinase [Polyangiaceae bacterium]
MLPSQIPPAPAATEAEAAFSPALIIRAVRKHWQIVVAVLVGCVVCAWLYTANQRNLYEAVATVQLDPQPLTPMGHTVAESGTDSYWSNQEYFATQYQVITSRRVAEAVVRKLHLNSDGAFLSERASAPTAQASTEDAAEVLRARLKVAPITDSRLARVLYTDADSGRAQRILSAVVDTYVEQNLDTSLDATNKTVEWLDTQLTRLKSDLESQEMDLHDFKIKYNLLSVSYDDQSNMVRAEIQQLNSALTDLKGHKEAVAARLALLKNVDPQDPAEIPTTDLLASVNLSDLRASYVSAKREAAMLRASGKGSNHPDVQAADAQVEASRVALVQELQNIKNGAQMELASVGRQLGGLTGLYDAARHEALELNLKELEYSRLQRSKENTEKLFGLVLERSTESGLSKMAPFNNVRVLDRPLRPLVPVFPRTSTNLAVGIAFGLLLGLAGAVSRDMLDRTVRNSEDLERELGLAVLGSLPDVAQEGGTTNLGYYGYGAKRRRKKKDAEPAEQPDAAMATELLVHTHPKSVVAEAARAIRTNLMFMSPDNPYRCLLVTSAGPAEGKTTVATSIAIAIAQTGQRVCLVDCDLRKPRVHTLFKERNDKGVTTALLDPSQLPALILDTSIPNLSVLRAGPTPPNPADLMHSEAFGRLLEELRGQFDRLVIDSPPIGLVTDGVILSTRVDATVLVVRALATRRDAAKRAVRSLRDVGATCAGFVLNAVASQERYYYSGYYAPYGASEKEAPLG